MQSTFCSARREYTTVCIFSSFAPVQITQVALWNSSGCCQQTRDKILAANLVLKDFSHPSSRYSRWEKKKKHHAETDLWPASDVSSHLEDGKHSHYSRFLTRPKIPTPAVQPSSAAACRPPSVRPEKQTRLVYMWGGLIGSTAGNASKRAR